MCAALAVGTRNGAVHGPHHDDHTQIAITIAGWTVVFKGLSLPLVQAVQQRYANFLSGQSHQHHEVTVFPGREVYLDPAEDRFLRLEMYSTGDERILVSNHFAASRNNRKGRLSIGYPDSIDATLEAIENYLRWYVAQTIAEQGSGLLLHAAGVINGKAYIFMGHSGAGKSTIAQLSAPRPVLSDDLVLLQQFDDVWYACSAPFAGTLAPPQPALGQFPVAAIFSIHQALMPSTKPLSRSIAFAKISSMAPFLTQTARPELSHMIGTLIETVPVVDLHFPMNPGFWDILS